MSILRPIFLSVLRPATPVFLSVGSTVEQLTLHLLGSDGSLTMIDAGSGQQRVVAINDTNDGVTLEVEDHVVIAESASSVTLELGV